MCLTAHVYLWLCVWRLHVVANTFIPGGPIYKLYITFCREERDKNLSLIEDATLFEDIVNCSEAAINFLQVITIISTR